MENSQVALTPASLFAVRMSASALLAEREPMRSSTRGREGREGNPISLKHAPAGPLRGLAHMTSALRKGDILSEFVTDEGGTACFNQI